MIFRCNNNELRIHRYELQRQVNELCWKNQRRIEIETKINIFSIKTMKFKLKLKINLKFNI